MNTNDRSLDSFKKFLDSLLTSKDINTSTAKNIKNSSLRLLTPINSSEIEDILKVNVDDLVKRFSDSANPSLSESSLNTYKSRFEKAIELFKLTDNKNNQQPKPIGKLSILTETKSINTPTNTNEITQENTVKTFVLPIPLRSDLIVEIKGLPRDLSIDEADRIANIIKSFSIG